MDSRENVKQSKIHKHETPIEKVIYDEFSDTFDMYKAVVSNEPAWLN